MKINYLSLKKIVTFTLLFTLFITHNTVYAQDTDGDGVADINDLDDDNDGILDCDEKLIGENVAELFVANSDASFITTTVPQEVLITPAVQQQQGQLWARSKADFSEDFTLTMQAYLGASDGADGISITFHDDPLGLTAAGAPGQGIGSIGIQNGISLEIDTFDNSFDPSPLNSDIAADHGTIRQTSDGTVLSTAIALPELEDNNWHDVVITWNAATSTLEYTVDGTTAGSYTNPNIINDIFGGASKVYFGYTGSTGNVVNEQKIRFLSVCDSLANLEIDTDNDGIPDHLDLDSDNDGCLDALEGSGSIVEANLVASGGSASVGAGSTASNKNLCADNNCIDTNAGTTLGVPTVIGAGQAIGSSKDASTQAQECCDGGTVAPVLSPTSAIQQGSTLYDLGNVSTSPAPANSVLKWYEDSTLTQEVNPLTVSAGTYYAAFTATNCKSPYAQFEVLLDSDGDGVEDLTDLDDDNDGILDSDECESFSNTKFDINSMANVPTRLALGVKNYTVKTTNGNPVSVNIQSDATFNSNIIGVFPNYTNAVSQNQIDISAVLLSETTVGTTVTGGDELDSNFNVIGNNETFEEYNYTLNFSIPVKKFELVFYDFDRVWQTYEHIKNVSIPPTSVSGSDYNYMGNSYASRGRNRKIVLTYNLASPITTISFTIGRKNGYACGFAVEALEGCAKDTDGDGIQDSLDLDSDNDGCPDAKEGAADLEASNTNIGTLGSGNTISGSNANLTTTDVDANGVPNAATSSGQSVGNSQLAYKNDCLDSDGDTVPDWADLDDDNDGILDSDECVAADLANNFGTDAIFIKPEYFIPTTPASNYPFSNQDIPPTDISDQFGYPANSGAVIVEVKNASGIIGVAGSVEQSTIFVGNAANPTEFVISGTVGLQLSPRHGQRLDAGTEDGVTILDGVPYIFPAPALPPLPTDMVSGSTGNYYYIRNQGATSQNALMLWYPQSAIDGSPEILRSKHIRFSTTDPRPATPFNLGYYLQATTECDDDMDGIPNRLDLDTDNDGCPDAKEGIADLEPTNTSVGALESGNTISGSKVNLTITDVDSDGVPTIATNSGQAVGQAQDASKNDCVDTDADGIADWADLDDDNDGILDTNECTEQNIFTSAFVGASTSVNSWPVTNSLSGESGIGFGVFPADSSKNGLVNTGNNLQVSTIKQTVTIPSYTNKKQITIDFAWRNTPATIDSEMTIEFIYAGTTYGSIITSATDATSISWKGNNGGVTIGTPPAGALGASDTWTSIGQIKLILPNTVSNTGDFEIKMTSGASTLAVDDIFIDNIKMTFCDDLDGDGIPNNLDLDSDNDGCPDAKEGDKDLEAINTNVGTLESGNTISGSKANLGNTVGDQPTTIGVPTSAGTGQQIGQSQDASKNDCADVDNDGVADWADVDDDNDGILDTDENCYGYYAMNNDSSTPWLGLSTSNLTTTLPAGFNYQTSTATYRDNDNGYFINQTVDGIVAGQRVAKSGDFTNLTYTFDSPVKLNEIAFYAYDIDRQTNGTPGLTYTVLIDGVSPGNKVRLEKIATNSGSAISGQDFHYSEINGTISTNKSNDNQIFMLKGIDANTTITTFSVSVSGVEANDLVAYSLFALKVCDNDNDGIPNYLDLDSDNDGCLDAIEGNASFTTSDVEDATDATGVTVGTGSTADNKNLGNDVFEITDTNPGLPKVAGTGQQVGSSQTAGTVAITQQPTDVTVCDESDATFSVTATVNPTGNYNYQWQVSTDNGVTFTNVTTNGSGSAASAAAATLTVPSASVTNGNQYKVVISSTNNTCPLESNIVTLYKNNVTKATIAAPQTICEGEDPAALNVTVNSSGAGTISYSWEQTTDVPTAATRTWSPVGIVNSPYDPPVLTETTYYRQVVSSELNGVTCTDTSNEVVVTVNPLPTEYNLTASPAAVCSGGSTTITLANSETGVKYQLKNGAANVGTEKTGTGSSIDFVVSNITADATYSIEATNTTTNCSRVLTSTASVMVNALPSTTPTVSNITECAQSTIQTLTATASGAGTGESYVWYDAATGGNEVASPTHNTIGSTSYWVAIKNDATGCVGANRAEVVLTINALPTITSSVTEVCTGETITIQGSAVAATSGAYLSSNTAVATIDSVSGLLTGVSAGTTTITYTNNEGCTVTQAVTVNATPTKLNPTPTQSLCSVASPTVANLSPAPSTTVKWYTSETGGTALADTVSLNSITYWVAETNVSGCEGERAQVVVQIVATPGTPIVDTPQEFCSNVNPTVADLTASANSGGSINWYTVQTGGTALVSTTALTQTTYYVSETVTGCEGTRLAVTVMLKDCTPPVPDVVANADGSATITPDTSSNPDATSTTITYTKTDGTPGTIVLTKDPSGNWSSDNPSIPVDPTTGVVTIPADEIKDGTIVKAVSKDDAGNEGTDEDTVGNPVPTPDVVANSDGSVNITPDTTPNSDTNKTTITYVQTDGTTATAVLTKDSSGNWVSNNPDVVVTNPTTGEATIADDKVKDGTTITAVSEDEAGQTGTDNDTLTNPAPTPDVVANNDGSVNITPDTTPNSDTVETTITYVKPDGTQGTAVLTKNPSTGEWTSNNPDVVVTNPTTGEATIADDKVKDGTEVTATSKDEDDQTGNDSDTTKDQTPPQPDVVANNDGTVTVNPDISSDPNAVTTTITYTKPDGTTGTVVLTKDPTTGEWSISNGNTDATVDPTTGVATFADDKVKDGTEVTAVSEDTVGQTGTDTDVHKKDTDGDGVPDALEIANGTDPNDPCSFNVADQISEPTQAWNDADCDGDGVTNGQEKTDGTDPKDGCSYNVANQDVTKITDAWKNLDCDGDGFTNEDELTEGTNPNDLCEFPSDITKQTVTPSQAWNNADCDNDGLSNGKEKDLGTDPNNPDTDGDGVLDGTEVSDGTIPTNGCDYTVSSQDISIVSDAWKSTDCDNDGLTNQEEVTGVDDPSTPANPNGNTTDPRNVDTDGDGVTDAQEALDGTNPNDPCDYNATNQDISAVTDAWKNADCDNDGLSNVREQDSGTDPNNPDTDGDGVLDGTEVSDGTIPTNGCDYTVSSQDISIVSDAWKSTDCDNDGLTNQEEVTGVDDPSTPANPNGNTTDPRNVDTDGDGVTDAQEALDGTNPNDLCDYNEDSQDISAVTDAWKNADCDGDGITNGGGTSGGNGKCLTVFNELTPNGDGKNDYLEIECIEQYPNNTIEIFNRWGNTVYKVKGYSNTDPSRRFDGLSNGRATLEVEDKLPTGTYFYVLDLGDGSQVLKGWLYISSKK